MSTGISWAFSRNLSNFLSAPPHRTASGRKRFSQIALALRRNRLRLPLAVVEDLHRRSPVRGRDRCMAFAVAGGLDMSVPGISFSRIFCFRSVRFCTSRQAPNISRIPGRDEHGCRLPRVTGLTPDCCCKQSSVSRWESDSGRKTSARARQALCKLDACTIQEHKRSALHRLLTCSRMLCIASGR